MTKRQDLERKYAAAAELRTKKVDEIRELLAIPPDPGDEQAVEFIARWRETGEVSVPAQLLTKAQRLLRECHSIHKACMEIQNEFEQTEPAPDHCCRVTSLLRRDNSATEWWPIFFPAVSKRI